MVKTRSVLLFRRWRRLVRGDELSERVRRTLVATLYTNPFSLAVGAAIGIVTAVVVAVYIPTPAIIASVASLTVVAVARVALALILAERTSTSTRNLELLFEIGAFSYALLFGLIGALAIVSDPPIWVAVMATANSLCYGMAITARNAGRPMIAMGQMLLAFIPVTIACFVIGTIPMIALAATIIMVSPAMVTITLNVAKVLRKSISAAETAERLARKMEHLAHTDVVTGLKNRAGLNESLATELMETPSGQRMAMFWLDLDRFKEVNDLLGHQTGDRVLAEVARRLRSALPDDAGIARFGGDEFVLYCAVKDRVQAGEFANKVLEEIKRPMRLDNERLEVGTSIGIAVLPDDGINAERLMQAADLALYHAKVEGRGRVRFFDQSMTRDLVHRREIEAELRLAIQRDELSLFFQPIVDLETGKIRAFEALLRWFHPVKGELRPDEFIPVAEETGVIVTLGNWITRQAAMAAAQWPEDITVAVNLSPLQIKAPGAALGIEAALRDARLEPSRLELEVTESLFIEDSETTAQFIEELSAKGVRFALDDFGTGYSSLAYINRFPFSKIKVDRTFVSGANTGKRANAIIRAVAEMGSQLGMDIVAEGLEEIEQVHVVRDAGCNLGQGYYFSRAVPDYLAAMLLAQERDKDQQAVA